MAKIVVVGCKLPTGIILESPVDSRIQVELNGANKETIIGSGYGSTEVDGDFWDMWSAQNKDFPPLKSKAIFLAREASELKAETTGLEPMRTDGNDKRAKGVKKVDKE